MFFYTKARWAVICKYPESLRYRKDFDLVVCPRSVCCMSESSVNKTRRKFINLLTAYNWTYQHSVFYVEHAASVALLNDMVSFKQKLRRECPDQPFLLRMMLLNRDKNEQAYLTIFTTAKTPEVERIAGVAFSAETKVRHRKCSTSKLASITSAIAIQKPHNLNRFFGKKKVNRYSVLNGHLLDKHRLVLIEPLA